MRSVRGFSKLALFAVAWFIYPSNTYAIGIHLAPDGTKVAPDPDSAKGQFGFKIADEIDKFMWPVIAITALFLFRKPALGLLDAMGKQGGTLDVSIFKIAVEGLKEKVEGQDMKLAGQQGQLNTQDEKIQHLIKFSMSWFIYKMLSDLRDKEINGGEYIYKNNGSMDRNIRFLIDHGYVRETYDQLRFDTDIMPFIKITKAGADLLEMRGPANDRKSEDEN